MELEFGFVVKGCAEDGSEEDFGKCAQGGEYGEVVVEEL